MRKRSGLPETFSDTDALLRLVPEQLPLFIYVYDLRERRNVYTNRHFTEFLGYPRENDERIASELLSQIIHPDDRDILAKASQTYAKVADQEIVETEFRMRNANGKWHWLRSRNTVFSRLPDGKPHLLLGVAQDVTAQKESELAEQRHREEREQEHQRLRSLLELNERERQLIAYDIHDGFVQDALSAQLVIDNMLEDLARSHPESVQPLLRVRAFVRKAIEESRRVVSELRPAMTNDTGLVQAIQFLVNEEEAAGRLDVSFTYPKGFGRLSGLLERSLVRIVQESLTNIKRHAKTKEAEIRLSLHGNEIQLEIEDHGVGFKPDEIPPDRFGLEGIRSRARVFGGKMVVRSRRGGGTLISVTVPVEKPEVEKRRTPAKPKGTKTKAKKGKRR